MTKTEMEEDYDPIDSSVLEVYALPDWMDKNNESPTINLVVDDVSTNCPMSKKDEIQDLKVEIEYIPDDLIISEESFREFLYSFQTATICQEEMSALVQSELKENLELDDVFVNISLLERVGGIQKQTWTGGVR